MAAPLRQVCLYNDDVGEGFYEMLKFCFMLVMVV